MLKPVRRFAIRAMVFAALLLSPVVPAAADPTPGGEVNHCTVNVICAGTNEPGTKPTPGTGGGGGGGGGGPELCSYHGVEWPCHDPELGWFSNSTGCYYQLTNPQPPADSPDWEGHKPSDGAVYDKTCRSSDGGQSAPEPTFFAQAPAGPPPDNPVALARQAADRITFPAPVPGIAPQGTAVVGVPVWLWLDQSKGSAVPAPVTVHGNTLSVTVTPKLDRVVWDLGDGRVETCEGQTAPGTPYDPAYGAAASPTCGHVFAKGSATLPTGTFFGSVTAHWTAYVTVTGSNQKIDPLQMTRMTDLELRVAEVQVLN
ncbi:hypothetical protein [Kitasatospora sp. NPDC088351]|uniref:hypothetical protein n=1 Tax=Kitasatospora sp. NPDC088351 TaxID=3155180 RepID=UPI0034478A5F